MTPWFDAHLDLAYLAALGRDMLAPAERAGGPDLPAAVTLATLAEGGVGACLSTIFVEGGGEDPRASYPIGDQARAHALGVEQLSIYERWGALGLIAPLRSPGTGPGGPLRVGVLIEGADVIREPAELEWWARRGVVAVGLSWRRASRYAGGNSTPADSAEAGLSDTGRALVVEMDRLGLVHDVSHLADRACAELLDLARGRVIASHSNSRRLMGDPANQRHLTDAQIRVIASRGGVVGLNLYSRFLSPSARDTGGRARIADAVAHVEHVSQVAGTRACVGLGSDMDGGFSAAALPAEIDRVADLSRIADALRARGWSDAEVEAFRFGNWARIFGVVG